jgi:CDP-glucose 4,6-dehydratase
MGSGKGERYCGAWNFGPDNQSVKRVRDLVEEVIRCWGNGEWVDTSDSSQPYEATLLALCCDKAVHELGWQPAWDFTRTVAETVRWYKTWKEGRENLRQLCLQQIEEYSRST